MRRSSQDLLYVRERLTAFSARLGESFLQQSGGFFGQWLFQSRNRLKAIHLRVRG
ncbi:MAG TPA: hypothetical protein VKX25_09560 [Bryobacteraceae bacterium]|nr:hypothetical protein [Bryobacteraceae bacterium]